MRERSPKPKTKPTEKVQKAIRMIQDGRHRDRQIIEASKVKGPQALEAIKSKLKLGKYDLDFLTS